MWRWIPTILVALMIAVALSRFLRARRDVHEERMQAITAAEEERRKSWSGSNQVTGEGVGRSGLQPPEETTGARLARWLSGTEIEESHRLAPVEVMEYVAQNQSNAFSLVTAFAASGDREYLKMAAERFPDDPLVQSRVLLHDLFPEERWKWIDRLKESSPENSLPHFLAARELLEAGDVAGAVAEINGARAKEFNDFTKEMALAGEEAYLSAGRSPAEAKAMGNAEVLLPHLAQMKQVGIGLIEKAGEYGAGGDAASQEALLVAGWEIGRQMQEEGNKGMLITELVGVVLQNEVLRGWPEGMEVPFLEQSPGDQLAENQRFRAEVREYEGMMEEWLRGASENEIIAHFERMRVFGELEALRWLKNQRNARQDF